MADVGEVVARISVDISAVKDQMDEVVSIMKDAGKQMSDALANASASMRSSTTNITNNFTTISNTSSNTTSNIVSQFNTLVNAAHNTGSNFQQMGSQISASLQAIEKSNAGILKELQSNVQGLQSPMAGLAAATNTSATAQRGHAAAVGTNSVAMREFLVMLREAGRGDMTRFAGSMSLFIGSFAAGRAAIGAILGPIGIMTGVVAGLAYAMHLGWTEQRDFNRTMAITKNSAGLTEDAFNSLSKTLAGQTNSTLGETRNALTRIASSGEYSKKTMDLMAIAALEFGKKTGIGVEAALDKFMIADRNVARSAAELNKQYGFLSIEEAKRIKRLSDMGDKDGATAILMAAVGREAVKVAENLGTLEKAWNDVKKAASDAIQTMMSWGKDPTLAEKHQQARQLRDDLQQVASNLQSAENQAKQNGNTERAIVLHNQWLKVQGQIKDQTVSITKAYQDMQGEAAKAAAKATTDNKTKSDVDKILQPPKPEKKEKGLASELEKLKEQNEEMQLEKERDLAKSGKYYETANEDSKKFWESQLNNSKLTQREQVEVTRLTQAAEAKVLKQGLDEKKHTYEEEYAAAKGNFDRQRELLNQRLTMYQANSEGRKAIINRMTALDGEERAEKERTAIKGEEDAKNEFLNELQIKEGAAKVLLENGSINNKQYLKMMQEFNQKILETKIIAIKEEAKIEDQYGAGDKRAEREKVAQGKIIQAEREFQKEKNKIDADMAKENQKIWKSIGTTMSTALTSSIEQIVMHQKNMVQNLRNIWNTMLQSFLKMGVEMAEGWALNTAKQVLITQAGEEAKANSVGIASKLISLYQTMTGQTVIAQKATETTAVVGGNAAQAATGAAASVSRTPFVGPVLAAAAFAAVMALCMGAMKGGGGATHSASGGFDIGNFEPVTQLHKKEMVLPAPLADGFRNIIQSASNNSSKNNVTHNNTVNMQINARDADSFRKSEIEIHRQASMQLKRYGR